MKAKEARYINFIKYNLELIALENDVTEVPSSRAFIIDTDHFGPVTYFPKADKIQIHNGNKWIPNGLNWIKKNIKIAK